MRETLHIFAKDSRHLWVPVLLMVGALVFFVNSSLAVLPVYDLTLQDTGLSAGIPFLVVRYSPLILAVGWCYLIVQVVHADALHGDRQFWLTRPYRRSSLFASKVLFVLTYINLPLAAAQWSILVLGGSSPLDAWPGLLWSQLLIVGLLIGPLLALAAMSVSMSWFAATLVPVAVVLIVIVGDTGRLERLDWVRLSCLGLFVQMAVAGVLWVQYRHRRTRLARTMLALAAVAAFVISRGIDWETAFSVQQRVQGGSANLLSASLAPPVNDATATDSGTLTRSTAIFDAAPGGVRVPLWFTVEGAASGVLIACEASRVTLTTASGEELRDSVRIVADGRLTRPEDGCPGFVTLPRTAEAFTTAPVSIEADLYLTVFDAAQTFDVPLGARRSVPGVGECAARRLAGSTATGDTLHVADVACHSAFRSPRVAVTFSSPDLFWATSRPASRPTYAPWPAELRLQPIERIGRIVRTDATFISVETRPVLAHARLRVNAANVDLNAYRIPMR